MSERTRTTEPARLVKRKKFGSGVYKARISKKQSPSKTPWAGICIRYPAEKKQHLKEHSRSLNMTLSEYILLCVENDIKNNLQSEQIILGSLNTMKADVELVKNMQAVLFQFLEDFLLAYLGHTPEIPAELRKVSHKNALARYARFKSNYIAHIHQGNTIEKLLASFLGGETLESTPGEAQENGEL